MGEQADVFEEYDGLNNSDAEGVLLVVALPLLSRGHAVQCHVLNNENVMVQVPNIYNLLLGLPIKVDTVQVKTFFDCKIRRLFVHMPKLSTEEVASAATQEDISEPAPLVTEAEDAVVEIDTDDYFKKPKSGKVQKEEKPAEEMGEMPDADDLLYDLC